MKIIKPSFEIMTDISPYGTLELEQIERAARVCYKSEGYILDQAESAKKLIKKLIQHGHEAMLEHSSLMVKFICDRGVSHELVRHRMASFAQESTRYCNYSKDQFGKEITVIMPSYLNRNSKAFDLWGTACTYAETRYFELLNEGLTPEQARCVLPNSLKTEVVVTANYREWRHILDLRSDNAAHPQMRELMLPLLKELYERIPVIFDDIYEKRFKAQ